MVNDMYNSINNTRFITTLQPLSYDYIQHIVQYACSEGDFRFSYITMLPDADNTHCVEFTSFELYTAYADYYDLMDMTDKYISGSSIILSNRVLLHFC